MLDITNRLGPFPSHRARQGPCSPSLWIAIGTRKVLLLPGSQWLSLTSHRSHVGVASFATQDATTVASVTCNVSLVSSAVLLLGSLRRRRPLLCRRDANRHRILLPLRPESRIPIERFEKLVHQGGTALKTASWRSPTSSSFSHPHQRATSDET